MLQIMVRLVSVSARINGRRLASQLGPAMKPGSCDRKTSTCMHIYLSQPYLPQKKYHLSVTNEGGIAEKSAKTLGQIGERVGFIICTLGFRAQNLRFKACSIGSVLLQSLLQILPNTCRVVF